MTFGSGWPASMAMRLLSRAASWTEPNSIAAANGAKIVLTRSRAASSIDGLEKHATYTPGCGRCRGRCTTVSGSGLDTCLDDLEEEPIRIGPARTVGRWIVGQREIAELHLRLLAERPLEHLIDVGIREGLQRLWPRRRHGAPLAGRPHLPIPTDLLHVVVELDAVAVRVQRERRVVDAGIELRRYRVDERHPVRFQEGDGLAQLGIAPDLDPEGHAARVLGEAERAPELLGEEPHAVMLRARAQEHTARAAIGDLLALHEAEVTTVERLGARHVGHE